MDQAVTTRIATKARARAPRDGRADKAVRPGIGDAASNRGVTGSRMSKIVDSSLVRTLVVLPTFNERENIARLIYDYAVSQGFPVAEVRLWETESCFATYTGPGRPDRPR